VNQSVFFKKLLFLGVCLTLTGQGYGFSVFSYIPAFLKPKSIAQPCIAYISIPEDPDFYAIARQLVAATKNPAIDGAILLINNLGGNLGAYCVIHDLIKKLSETKPVVGVIGAYAFSCGYLLASATNFIFAHAASGIGSIGVVSTVQRYKNPKVKNDTIEADLQIEVMRAGEFKGLYDQYAPDLTEPQKKAIGDELDESYALFIELVAQNKKLNKDDYRKWAEGRTFLLQKAQEFGLIDERGTIFDAEEKVRELVIAQHPSVYYAPGVQLITV
jgi:protease-4